MPAARTTTSQSRPLISGDNSPILRDWRWVVGRAVERAGNQSKLAILLGTKEQNVRRWINNDDDPSPTHNDQMKFVDAMYQREPAQARTLLADILESLGRGRVRLADSTNPSRDEAAAQVRAGMESFITGPFAGGGGQ